MASTTAPKSKNPTATSNSYIPVRAGETAEKSSPPSDEELIAAIAGGSREALEALYDRYSGAVYALAVNILRDSGAAEEAAQDTFFNVWRRASSYSPEKGKVTSWLFSIGHHRVIDEVRKRKRREQPLVGREVDMLNQPDNGHNDPIKHAALQVVRDEIKKAMSALRPEQREVVVARLLRWADPLGDSLQAGSAPWNGQDEDAPGNEEAAGRAGHQGPRVDGAWTVERPKSLASRTCSASSVLRRRRR